MGESKKKNRTTLNPGECRRVVRRKPDGKPDAFGRISKLSASETSKLRAGVPADRLNIGPYVLKPVKVVEQPDETAETVAGASEAVRENAAAAFAVYRDSRGRYAVAPYVGRRHKVLGRLAFRRVRGRKVDCVARGAGAAGLAEYYRDQLRGQTTRRR